MPWLQCKQQVRRWVHDMLRYYIFSFKLYTSAAHIHPLLMFQKKNWRAEHENFIKTIRYAKAVTDAEKGGGNVADLPPPPVTENPDYKECPYCHRTFNPTTAERHIPHCKNTKARPAPVRQRRR